MGAVLVLLASFIGRIQLQPGRFAWGHVVVDVDKIVAVERIAAERPGGAVGPASVLVLQGDVRIIVDMPPAEAMDWWTAMSKGEHVACKRG